MDTAKIISEIRTVALTKHKSVAAWLKAAGVAPSTYYAWISPRKNRTRKGVAARISYPSTKTLLRLEKAAR